MVSSCQHVERMTLKFMYVCVCVCVHPNVCIIHVHYIHVHCTCTCMYMYLCIYNVHVPTKMYMCMVGDMVLNTVKVQDSLFPRLPPCEPTLYIVTGAKVTYM